jgi:hypothetical protein
MRYKEILAERRRQRTTTYYHGTIGEFVPSILKHGLIPNPKFRNYDDDNVLAFKQEDKDFINWNKHLDWNAIIERSIIKKTETIFEAQGWGNLLYKLKNTNQIGLF